MDENLDQEFGRSQSENDSVSTMLFLMGERDLELSDLVPILGSEAAVEQMISGTSPLDRSATDSIGQFLGVGSMLFG
jgi:antitoxin component HigA of HigAB toxin-antitoxin module